MGQDENRGDQGDGPIAKVSRKPGARLQPRVRLDAAVCERVLGTHFNDNAVVLRERMIAASQFGRPDIDEVRAALNGSEIRFGIAQRIGGYWLSRRYINSFEELLAPDSKHLAFLAAEETAEPTSSVLQVSSRHADPDVAQVQQDSDAAPADPAHQRLDAFATRAQPALTNLPFLRNIRFMGRSQELRALRASFLSGSSIQALTGLGGIGKTELATEYAYLHSDSYPLIWWVRSSSTGAIIDDYVALGIKLRLFPATINHSSAADLTREWLEEHTHYLLIFDDADTEATLRTYLPRTGGHTLITSRNRGWHTTAHCRHLTALSPPESLAFIRSETGTDDDAASARLAELLEYLPLALAQATAYIRTAKIISLSQYIDLFQTRSAELLKRGSASHGYPHTVHTVWNLSFHKIAEQSAAAAELLSFSAFLGPDVIRYDLLIAGQRHFSPDLQRAIADPLLRADLVIVLDSQSLITVAQNGLVLHSLIQDVLRDQQPLEQRNRLEEVALAVMSDAFPKNVADVESWPRCGQLQNHVAAVLAFPLDSYSAKPNSRTWHFWSLSTGLGTYLSTARGDVQRGIQHLRRAIEISHRTFGEDHLSAAGPLNALACVLEDPHIAASLLSRALAIKLKWRPQRTTDEHIALYEARLGEALVETGDIERARNHLESALAFYRARHGDMHTQVAILLAALGRLSERIGDINDARRRGEAGLLIANQIGGIDRRAAVQCLRLLAHLHVRERNYHTARLLLETALSASEMTYGDAHPVTKNIVVCLRDCGSHLSQDDSDVVGCSAPSSNFLPTVDIAAAFTQRENIAVVENQQRLAVGFWVYGDVKSALQMGGNVLARLEFILGPTNSKLALLCRDFAIWLELSGDEQALEYYNRAVTIATSPEWPANEIPGMRGDILATVAARHLRKARNADAEPILALSIAYDGVDFAANDPAKAANRLADSAVDWRNKRRWAEAGCFFERAVALLLSADASNRSDLGSLQSDLAAILLRMHITAARARTLMNDALKNLQKAHGASHPKVRLVRRNISLFNSALAQYAGSRHGQRGAEYRILPPDDSVRAFLDRHIVQTESLSAWATVATDELPGAGLLWPEMRHAHDPQAAVYAHEALVAYIERTYAPSDMRIAVICSNLAVMYARMRDDSAVQHYDHARQVLAESAAKPQPMQGALWATYKNFGIYHREHDENEAALDFFSKALAFAVLDFGYDHIIAATTLLEFAVSLMEMRRWQEAKTIMERALSTLMRALPSNDAGLAHARSIMGTILTATGDLAEAAEQFQTVLEVVRGLFGDEHPAVRQTLADLEHVKRLHVHNMQHPRTRGSKGRASKSASKSKRHSRRKSK